MALFYNYKNSVPHSAMLTCLFYQHYVINNKSITLFGPPIRTFPQLTIACCNKALLARIDSSKSLWPLNINGYFKAKKSSSTSLSVSCSIGSARSNAFLKRDIFKSIALSTPSYSL